MGKVYVIMSLYGGVPNVEAVLADRERAEFYFEELIETHTGPGVEWERSDNNGNCVFYATDNVELDIRVYERNLL